VVLGLPIHLAYDLFSLALCGGHSFSSFLWHDLHNVIKLSSVDIPPNFTRFKWCASSDLLPSQFLHLFPSRSKTTFLMLFHDGKFSMKSLMNLSLAKELGSPSKLFQVALQFSSQIAFQTMLWTSCILVYPFE